MAAEKPHNNSPVSFPEFNSLIDSLGPFERYPHIAVALSGGCDSMALTLLTHQWVKERGGKLTALTVDHGLRPESAEEAKQIHGWCKQLGIEHSILPWTPPSHITSVQNSARDARYKLLAEYCKAHHILHLLTGHQREDQVETLAFRLARGSGVSGLSAMGALSELSGIRLLRPLLSIPKARLIATLDALHHPWVEDPSNQKTVYTRNHIRKILASSSDTESLHSRTSHVVSRFAEFRNLLNYNTASYLTNAISIYPEGYGKLHQRAFLELSDVMALEVLAALVVTLTGAHYPPRSEKLERLCIDLRQPQSNSKRSAFGLIFELKVSKNEWLVSREANAIETASDIKPSEFKLWDQRFCVGFSGAKLKLQVRALGGDGIAWLKSHEGQEMRLKHYDGRKMVLASLPSFWHLENVIAIPHISYLHTDYSQIKFTAQFIPAKPLAGHAFLGMNVLKQTM